MKDFSHRLKSVRRQRDARVLAMIAGFYLLDAAFLYAYSLLGVLPLEVPSMYGLAGFAVCAVFGLALRFGWNESIGRQRAAAVQVFAACCLMLITAAMFPAVGVLLLMTMVGVITTGALELKTRQIVGVCVVVAPLMVTVVGLVGDRLGLPLHTWPLRALAGTWIMVILFKGALLSVLGEEFRVELERSHASLATALSQLEQLATHDELTGLLNRRCILGLLEEERERAERTRAGFSVALLDIDRFKAINDRFGHGVGDEVLRAFASVITRGLRNTDRIARYGGEEFLLLLANNHVEDEALMAAERLRLAIEGHNWTTIAEDLHVTASIGLAFRHSGESVAEVIGRADESLYRAKHGGRNCVQVAGHSGSATSGDPARPSQARSSDPHVSRGNLCA